jgi:type I restriction enzyme, R subunit
LQIDTAIRENKSDGWRGNIAKENEIKKAIWKLVQDEDEVERIFNIITQQEEY